MNLNGEDSKYSCELHHGLHSWVGAATDGGYLGSDARAFVSAVLSGAAGYYALVLTGDAQISTALTIQPGQVVHISGDPALAVAPSWSNGFTVHGTLVLTYVEFGGIYISRITVEVEGSVTITSCTVIQGQGLDHLVVRGGGYLSLRNMTVHATTLQSTMEQLRSKICDPLCAGHGDSVLDLRNVVIPEISRTARSGVVNATTLPTNLPTQQRPLNSPLSYGVHAPGGFVVESGSCETFFGGRCIGYANGDGNNDACTFRAPFGALLGECPTWRGNWVHGILDPPPRGLTFPAGATLAGASYQYPVNGGDCPKGVAIPEGGIINWQSNLRHLHWEMCDTLPV
jgi:hypothetical protein